MIDETLGKIESRIQGAGSIPPEKREELLQLVSTLKGEVAELSKTNADQAQSIAGFTDVSIHEATRSDPDPQLLQVSLEGLTSTVRGFEETHPRLVQIVNGISTTLANLGI